MAKQPRINIVLDEKDNTLCRELASAKDITMTELFRQMLHKEAEENKELLRQWRAMKKLRK